MSLIDIVPTVLTYMGLKAHPNFQGVNVLDPGYAGRKIFITSDAWIPYDAVIDYPWKFVLWKHGRGKRLINLEKDEVTEKRDFSNDAPAKTKELSILVGEYITDHMYYYNQPKIVTYPPRF